MVITFLPYPSFTESAKVLDNQRLGKMRSETYIILQKVLLLEEELKNNKIVESKRGKYLSHPAVKMWVGYSTFLKQYFNAVVSEWVGRGFNNNYPLYTFTEEEKLLLSTKKEFPPFIGLKIFHYSQQASLKRKHPYYYSSLFTSLPEAYSSLGYFWPSNFSKEVIEYLLLFNDDDSELVLSPEKELFADINYSYLTSASKSELRVYSLPQLKELAKNNNIECKNLKKEEILILLKRSEIL